MGVERERAITDVLDLADACRKLQQQLAKAEAVYRKTAGDLSDGVSVPDAMAKGHTDVARRTVTDALREFEQFRHRARLSLSAAGMAEGMTISELGRAWGASRQLLQRLVREALVEQTPISAEDGRQ